MTSRVPTAAWSTIPIAAGIIAIGIAAAAFFAGRWLSPVAVPAPPDLVGSRLGGSIVAMAPLPSPDGQTIAFLSLVDGQTQVAVMKPQTGNWTVLTKERGRGLADQMSWSTDGSRIFYSRFLGVPNGLYAISIFGGEERLLLEHAAGPRALPDGSLLVTRINANREPQIHRFWPDTGRVEALPALAASLSLLPTVAYKVFPDAREFVYVGKPAGGNPADPNHFWVFDLTSSKSRRIGPDATLVFNSWSFPLAVSSDGASVLFTMPTGNMNPVVAIARDGSPGVRTVLPQLVRPIAMAMDAHGNLFMDQFDPEVELFRFDPASKRLERLPMPGTLTLEGGAGLPLSDGRVLLATRTLGHDRLVVMSPGKDPVPFIDTQEPTSGPLANAGPDRVVLVAGPPSARRIVLASSTDGRIVTRFARVDASQAITTVAGSLDGKTVFYVKSGNLWRLDGPDSEPVRVGAGDGVAVAPDGKSLVVMLSEAGGIRLVKRRMDAGPGAGEKDDELVPLSGLRLAPFPIAPNAIGRDGRLVLRVAPTDSWFWPAAILDPRSGRVEMLPEAAAADMLVPGWDAQGRVVTVATMARSALWRFSPATR